MNYNKELIELVAKLSPIQQQLYFENREDHIFLHAKEKDTAIAYILKAPKNYLDFPGDTLAFYEYKRFKDCFNIFDKPNDNPNVTDSPVLDTVTNDYGNVVDLLIKSSKNPNQFFTCRTAKKSAIADPGFNDIPFNNSDAAITLSTAQIMHLNKMINIIQADNMKFICENDTCHVTVFNAYSSDNYNIDYKLTETISDKIELLTHTTGFKLLPPNDYTVDFNNRGLIKFHQNRTDDINLDLFISKKRS